MHARTLSRRPILSLVTDRRRLAEAGAGRLTLLDLVARAVEAGVDLIQIRERDLTDADLLTLVRQCVAVADGSATAVVVNERVDVALAAGASGVHLPGTAVTAALVRRSTPGGFVIGRSVHNLSEALAAEASGGVDYLTFGTVFPSRSKPDVAPQGATALAALVRATRVPVLAIGGVAVDNTGDVFRAGASGVAAIDLFAEAARVDGGDGLRHVVDAVRTSYTKSHVSGE
ncbi:MAG: thiamine phosphate synthase [Acidobacteria bacterium]|nr:thiamine phosphate synthase [Acidobacteriota bacterium]